jgi:hypothetical protein
VPQIFIKRVLGGKGDVISVDNSGLVGPLVVPPEYAIGLLKNKTKICRAELGLRENYAFDAATQVRLESRGYDDPIKIGMLLAHQSGAALRGDQAYPQVCSSVLPFPLHISAENTTVVADDYFVERVLHNKFIDKNQESEWFRPVIPEEVRDTANMWRSYTHAAYINIHNPHAEAVLAICAAHDGRGLSTYGGKGFRRKRRLSELGAGSYFGSHDYDDDDDEVGGHGVEDDGD